MPFFGSSSKQQAAQGSAGAQTQTGDPLSVNLTAGDDLKNANVNVTHQVTVTDQGALAAGARLGEESIRLAETTVRDGLDLADSALARGFGFGRDALGFGRDSLDFAAVALEESLEAVTRSAADAVGASTAALREVNRDATERTSQLMLYVAGAVAAVALIGVFMK